MKIEPETLQRLHRVFFPESPPQLEWYERLACLVHECGLDDVDVIAHLRAMSLHQKGSSCGNPAVTEGVCAPLTRLKHFGSRVSLVISATASERWLEHLIEFYNQIGITPVFVLDSVTSDGMRRLLATNGTTCIDLGGESEAKADMTTIFNTIDTDWILHVDDNELPTSALFNFVDRAVEYSTKFIWGFPRVHCRYELPNGELQYSQFLSCGPFANAALQWRLLGRGSGSKERRSAPAEALLLNYDWILCGFAERVHRFLQQKAGEVQSAGTLSHFNFQEAIPECWHMFTPLPNGKYKEFARMCHYSDAQKGESSHDDSMGAMRAQTSSEKDNFILQDPAMLRDELIDEASRHFAQLDVVGGVATLRKLRWATVDNETLAKTDPYLAQISVGKRIVATCDPRRTPADNEIIVVYGNYPHIFENVVVNNPIKRHVASFGEFDYDDVEYDHRWDGIGQIYIINADHRPDRYDAVLRELASAKAPFHRITRVAAIKDETTGLPEVDGAIGCLRSHIDILRRAKLRGFDHTLILEDDFCFTTEINAHLDDLQAFLRGAYEYLICLLATSKYGRIIPKDEIISISLQPVTNTGAYLVSAAGIVQLLPVQEFSLGRLKETRDTLTYAADRCWSVLQSSGQFFVFRHKFGFQASSFSDIERSISRYLD